MNTFRSIVRGLILAVAAVLIQPAPVVAADAPTTITTIGDSYITGYGLLPKERFSARLQAALDAAGRSVKVVDPGYINTSAAGARWVTENAKGKALLAAPARQAVILELGQNDCPTYSIDETRANLDRILAELAEKKIPTLIVGTVAYEKCGPEYAAAFPGTFQGLATKYGDLLYADFKDGVTGHPDLLRDDGDHPNSAGEAIVVERMLPSVLKLLDRVAN